MKKLCLCLDEGLQANKSQVYLFMPTIYNLPTYFRKIYANWVNALIQMVAMIVIVTKDMKTQVVFVLISMNVNKPNVEEELTVITQMAVMNANVRDLTKSMIQL